jgi:hypothetical protein
MVLTRRDGEVFAIGMKRHEPGAIQVAGASGLCQISFEIEENDPLLIFHIEERFGRERAGDADSEPFALHVKSQGARELSPLQFDWSERLAGIAIGGANHD